MTRRNMIVTLASLGAAALAAVPALGAVYSTDATGDVNVNHYAATTDVYLNGGPPCQAAARGARLADGTYAFKVTDPSGRFDMSTDSVSAREFTVAGGVIVSSSDPTDHPVVATSCGAVVRVGPFAAGSRNGVYKVWVTPAANEASFPRNLSDTDNFTVGTYRGGGTGGGPYSGGTGGSSGGTTGGQGSFELRHHGKRHKATHHRSGKRHTTHRSSRSSHR